MRCRAPGKVLLSGAYAVLDGAPAIVAAVARYAVADPEQIDRAPAREIAFAFGQEPGPQVSTAELYDGERKLGIGSSAAALVAALGAVVAKSGGDLSTKDVRDALFRRARAAHAAVQSGGSGVDVAASVYGGILCYQLASPTLVEPVSLPAGLVVRVFSSRQAARTSDLRAAVARFGEDDPGGYGDAMANLHEAARESSSAVLRGDEGAFIRASRLTLEGLRMLGAGADMPIVPSAFLALAEAAESEGASFIPSGAGGGDVGVLFSTVVPSRGLLSHALALGLTALDMRWDALGVHMDALPARPSDSGPATQAEAR